MTGHLQDTVTLNNGVKMPWLGFGVYKAKEGSEVIEAVKAAIRAGYRSIDTAAMYGNEEGVGQAIREAMKLYGLTRDQIFVTTKVWNSDQGYETTLQAVDSSLRKLNLDYIDLMLIHWPVKDKYKETWRALEKSYSDGKVKAIGVSNFQIHHLEDLLESAKVKPVVNQVELHPQLSQRELLEYCNSKDIRLEAWSPLGRGKFVEHEELKAIGRKYGKTSAQVILRWDIQSGVVVIPKSVTESRIIENADIFDFELSKEDIQRINALNENLRYGADPDNFDF